MRHVLRTPSRHPVSLGAALRSWASPSPARRSLALAAIALATSVGTALAAPEARAGRVVSHPQGQFRLTLPDSFTVQINPTRLTARSRQGNVKIFARGEANAAPRYDFNGHFARWEQLVQKRGLYTALRRAGDRRSVRADGQVAVFRTYDAISTRNGGRQPYRVIVLAAHSPRMRRAYTLAVAAHAPTFAKYAAQLHGIAASFTPVAQPTLAKARPMSLRGRLVRKPTGQLAMKNGAQKSPAGKALAPKALVKRPAIKPAPKALVKRPAIKPAPKALVKRPAAKPTKAKNGHALTSTTRAKKPTLAPKKPATQKAPGKPSNAPKLDVPKAATEPVSLLRR